MAIAVAAASGCGGGAAPGPAPPDATPAPPPTDEEQVEALLERRADAFREGRPHALAATAVAGRRALERRAGKVAARLGLVDPTYVVEAADVRRRTARLRVRLDYGVRGVEGSFGVTRTLIARRTGDGWRIARAAGRRNADPWELGPYRRAQTRHFVVWTPPGVPVPEAALEAGYARMRDVLKRARLEDRYLAIVAADAGAARRLTQTISGVESLTALTDTQVRVTGRALRVTAIKSQRLILVHSRFGTLAPEEQASVVTHELTHAALAPQTSGRVPAWLVEGLAEYVSADDRRQEADYYRAIGLAPTLASLSHPQQIGALTGELQSAAYAEASSAAYNIAERFGRDKLIELYLVFNDRSLRGRRGAPRTVQRAMKRVLGIRLEDLQ